MKKVATKEIDGTLYPVEWAVDQCPYGQPGQACDLGGTCLLPGRVKEALLVVSGPMPRGLVFRDNSVQFTLVVSCNHQYRTL